MGPEILIVDDEDSIRHQVAGILDDEGYATRVAANSAETFKAIRARQPNLILLDIWLKDSELDGLQMLEIILKENPEQQVVMISGHATLDMAVQAIKSGAHDFLTKPFKSEVLLHTVAKAVGERRLREEHADLLKVSEAVFGGLSGGSPVVETLLAGVETIASTDSRVLITGPKGAGKNTVARLLHEKSRRRGARFVILDCAGMVPEQAEEELFGVEPAGDAPRKPGVLEQAHGGTVLLAAVEELPLAVQGPLARVLHTGAFRRIGAGEDSGEVNVDVRVLATTGREIEKEAGAGSFSEDLFHRLNVAALDVPALAERREDMPALLEETMAHSATKFGRRPRPFTPQAVVALQEHDWPGNVRELSNVVDRIVLAVPAAHSGKVTKGEAVEALGRVTEQEARRERNLSDAFMIQSLREARAGFEKEYLRLHLDRFGGNVRKTAEFVDMDRAALYRKLKSLDIISPHETAARGAPGATDDAEIPVDVSLKEKFLRSKRGQVAKGLAAGAAERATKRAVKQEAGQEAARMNRKRRGLAS